MLKEMQIRLKCDGRLSRRGSIRRLSRYLQLVTGCLAINACSAEMYCGSDDCYEMLGLTASADSGTIKKAYRKMSLKWHPDKNPEDVEEATIMFTKISRAYEVLSNDELRSAYDYARAHPEQAVYNQYRYYRTRLGQQVPLHVVMLGLLAFLTFLQILNQQTLAVRYRTSLQRTPLFKRQLQEATERRALELGMKRGSSLPADETKSLVEDLLSNAEVDGVSLAHFRITDLLAVKLVLCPFWLLNYVRKAPERRALRELQAEEARQQQAAEEAQLLEQKQRDEQVARRRVAAKDRKIQDDREIADAKERQRAHRQQEEEERKRATEARLELASKSRDYISRTGKGLGFRVDELRPLLSLGLSEVVALAEKLQSVESPSLHGAFMDEVNAAKVAAAKELEAKENLSRPPWHDDESGALAKGMQRFPGGTPNRWGKICIFIEQTTGRPRRTEADATDKARSLKDNAGRIVTPEASSSELSKKAGPAKVEKPAVAKDLDEGSAENEWTQAQQLALEDALTKFPVTPGVSANDRWERIAQCVEGKSKKQCLTRYKELREKVQST